MIEHIRESFNQVLTTGGFSYYATTILCFGIVLGGRLGQGMSGFKKSLVILCPFILVLALNGLTRVYEVSLVRPIGPQSYNGTVSLVLTSLSYLTGLFIGHCAVREGRRVAIIDHAKGLNSAIND